MYVFKERGREGGSQWLTLVLVVASDGKCISTQGSLHCVRGDRTTNEMDYRQLIGKENYRLRIHTEFAPIGSSKYIPLGLIKCST